MFARRRFVALCAFVVIIIGAFLAGRAIASPAEPVTTTTVTVSEGETLSQIAARELPRMELSAAVVAVQRENNLGSLHVQTGQVIHLPRS